MSADYERTAMTLNDSRGRELRVVRHYRDGIVLFDPVKLIVYDAGQKVAETPYCRDVIARRTSTGRMRVFGLGFSSALFNQVWVFDGDGLVEQRPLAARFFALAASLRSRWWGYGIAAPCSAYGAITYLTEMKAEGSFWFVPGLWPWFGFASLCAVFAYTPLSPLLVAGLAWIGTLLAASSVYEGALLAAVCGTVAASVSLPSLVVELYAQNCKTT